MRQKIAFALLMGVITTGIISFTLIAINIGFVDKFPRIWLRSWATAYVVVVPCILLVGPKIQALVNAIFPEKSFVEEQ